MPTTNSPNLQTTLIGTGLQSGTWGDTTNINLGTLLEQAISSYCTQQFSNADVTLQIITGTDVTGSTNVGAIYTAGTTAVPVSGRNMYIECQGSSTGNNLIVPTNRKLYFIYNNISSGGGTITVKTPTGTGIAVPVGRRALLACDGTNIVNAISVVNSITGTAPVSATTVGGVATISMPAATSGNSGYLTAANWSTFNGKQDAFTASTGLSLSSNTLKAVPRNTTSSTYSSWNSSTTDQLNITAQGTNITIGADSDAGATVVNGQKFMFRVTANGTITVSFTTGASYAFRSIGGISLASITLTSSQTLYVGCIYNSTALRWDVVAAGVS